MDSKIEAAKSRIVVMQSQDAHMYHYCRMLRRCDGRYMRESDKACLTRAAAWSAQTRKALFDLIDKGPAN